MTKYGPLSALRDDQLMENYSTLRAAADDIARELESRDYVGQYLQPVAKEWRPLISDTRPTEFRFVKPDHAEDQTIYLSVDYLDELGNLEHNAIVTATEIAKYFGKWKFSRIRINGFFTAKEALRMTREERGLPEYV